MNGWLKGIRVVNSFQPFTTIKKCLKNYIFFNFLSIVIYYTFGKRQKGVFLCFLI